MNTLHLIDPRCSGLRLMGEETISPRYCYIAFSPLASPPTLLSDILLIRATAWSGGTSNHCVFLLFKKNENVASKILLTWLCITSVSLSLLSFFLLSFVLIYRLCVFSINFLIHRSIYNSKSSGVEEIHI